jgi:hypothetical protein
MSQKKFLDMAIPAGAGSFAPEILYLNAESDVKQILDIVQELTVAIESLPAAATLEIDLLKADGTVLPSTSTSWLTAMKSIAAIGLTQAIALSGWCGVRIRGKSGGTAGSLKLHVSWI